MKVNTDPLEPDTYYHIYNRGINKENIFKEERNYSFFLERYNKFIAPVAETYSYCLLKNHFHVLIRTIFINLYYRLWSAKVLSPDGQFS